MGIKFFDKEIAMIKQDLPGLSSCSGNRRPEGMDSCFRSNGKKAVSNVVMSTRAIRIEREHCRAGRNWVKITILRLLELFKVFFSEVSYG
jgi:hypothetical protein